MQTLIDLVKDPVTQLVVLMYAALMIAEALFPAKQLPHVPYWKIKGIIFFILYFLVAAFVPMLITPYLEPYQLFDLSGLGVAGGAVAGVLMYEFWLYLWHRAMHESNLLWRLFHQMHHSAERMDTYGAFFFSPMDMIGFTLLSTVCFTLIAGFTPQAITIIILVTNFFSIFQHANLRTPRWLGYIIQRPESHAWHHATNVHRNNYSDLPLFDLLFGTFHNPATFPDNTGFYMGASSRTADMLLGRDIAIHEKPTPVQ